MNNGRRSPKDMLMADRTTAGEIHVGGWLNHGQLSPKDMLVVARVKASAFRITPSTVSRPLSALRAILHGTEPKGVVGGSDAFRRWTDFMKMSARWRDCSSEDWRGRISLSSVSR